MHVKHHQTGQGDPPENPRQVFVRRKDPHYAGWIAGRVYAVNDQKRTLQDHEVRDPAAAALAHGPSNSGPVLPPKLSLPVGLAIGAALLTAIIVWRRVSRTRSAGVAASNKMSS